MTEPQYVTQQQLADTVAQLVAAMNSQDARHAHTLAQVVQQVNRGFAFGPQRRSDAPPTIVNVTLPEGLINPAPIDVTVEAPPRRTVTDVERDAEGFITRTVATEEDAT